MVLIHIMSEQSDNSSHVGFYLLPRGGRAPSPPSPRHLQHRLSIINEVSEESSAASTPLSSPKHKPYEPNRIAEPKLSNKGFKRRGIRDNTISENSGDIFIDDQVSLSQSSHPKAGDYQTYHKKQDITIQTAGRGTGFKNESHQR